MLASAHCRTCRFGGLRRLRIIGLSQDRFAQRYGLTAARVRDWEQGRSQPDSAARAYLMVIEREPEAVERALAPKPAARARRREPATA